MAISAVMKSYVEPAVADAWPDLLAELEKDGVVQGDKIVLGQEQVLEFLWKLVPACEAARKTASTQRR
jgi:hypothetical protein